MSEEHKLTEPELDAPSLGQGLPAKPTVHALIANDLVIDLRDLFDKLDAQVKRQPPPFLRPPASKE